MTESRTMRDPPSPRSPTFIVGLDYGTHSTKIVVRRRDDPTTPDALIVDPRVGTETDEYPAFASPSLVLVKDDQIWFGREAWRRRARGQLHRSLKVRLLEHDTTDSPPANEVDVLVAAYLAWIIGGIRTDIEERTPSRSARIVLNVAAPMSHVENPELKSRYEHILAAAWAASVERRIGQGSSVRETHEILRPLIESTVAPESDRPFKVLPETVAPVISLSEHPDCIPGLYAVVDIGAGTTEISLIHVGEPGTGQKIVCYDDVSFGLGGDQLSSVTLSEQRELSHRFQHTLRKSWCTAYRKDAPNRAAMERWRSLRILRTGGAGKHPHIERKLAAGHPATARGEAAQIEVRRYEWKSWYDPVVRIPSAAGLQAPLHLLAVAHGLSIEAPRWPDWFRPSEVEKLGGEEARESDPNWYMD